MNQMADAIQYRRLRAPRRDGQALVEPSLSEATSLLQRNVAQRLGQDCDIHGRGLRELQADARSRLLRAAIHYTRQYRDLNNLPDSDAAIVAAGHQPELVHAGVWFKNFVLSHLAGQSNSWAVNLLIDNDVVRSTALRVPTGSVEDPNVMSVPMDEPGERVPFEARDIHDRQLFASFAGRVKETLSPLVADPLIDGIWPTAVEAAREHANLGQCLARTRHVLEGQWGLRSLEIPLSAVCDDQPFRWFAAHLLSEAGRLKQIYNQSLHEYRRVNRVRSQTHPVADLAERDGWIETPFWLWTREAPLRRPAFVRPSAGGMDLTDFAGIRIQLQFRLDGDAQQPVAQLSELAEDGVLLRPRALVTTMFARLILSDLFIHGIGGAKYDQLTDAIVRRFLGVENPEFLVATYTAMLPVRRISVDETDIRRTAQQLRELTYHPELHVDPSEKTVALIEEKRRLVQSEPPREQRRERHQRIVKMNESLQPFLSNRREQLLEQQRELIISLRKNAILSARDYAFCLFPEQSLRARLLELCGEEP
jgi:hypothetical protein